MGDTPYLSQVLSCLAVLITPGSQHKSPEPCTPTTAAQSPSGPRHKQDAVLYDPSCPLHRFQS